MATHGTINENRLEEIFDQCLSGCGGVIVEGITGKCLFDIGSLGVHREEIIGMLRMLPDNFIASRGGSWSLSMALYDRNGTQWTELISTCEKLFLLGIGLGVVEYAFPKALIPLLPGGLPYYRVNVTL